MTIGSAIKQHPVLAGATVGSSILLAGALGASVALGNKKKTSKARRTRTKRNKVSRSRSKSRKLKFGSKAYRKKYLKRGSKKHRIHTKHKRSTSHKRIRLTKNGQPYIITASGKARFISKKSSKSSRKRKGGRY